MFGENFTLLASALELIKWNSFIEIVIEYLEIWKIKVTQEGLAKPFQP